MPETNHRLPERIGVLAELAQNLWWSWQSDAREIFRSIDQRAWEGTRHNPLELLTQVSPERLRECSTDPAFLARYDAVVRRFKLLEERNGTWFARHYPQLAEHPIAYFSAEFALHRSIPVYSGGLGVLAGDLCKEASDLGVPVFGVGLFYHKGYFDQHLGIDGWQRDSDDPITAAPHPLTRLTHANGGHTLVQLPTAGRNVHIGAWRALVGRVWILLLDTDLEDNDPQDRELTGRLYGGSADWRLRQEWVLGVGGVRVLRALGIHPRVWHANEGHAALMYIERLRELTAHGVPPQEAQRLIRRSSVFTTHTPVAAGHDAFSLEQLEQVAGPFWETLGITRAQFAGFGQGFNGDGRFHMTLVGLRLAGRINGVAVRHGQESRHIWRDLWPDRSEEQVPIGHVTNGVHVGTWMSRPVRELLQEHLGADWDPEGGTDAWRRVLELDDAKLWAVHERLKHQLQQYIREEARHRWRDNWTDPAKLATAGALLSPNSLTIGFARRFATYKRADLLFRDSDRLRRLLTDRRRPVQIIFAGKAHPSDDPGKLVLQRVFTAAQDRSFEGRIAFLEDYEMHLAHRLVQGVDLWLNLPRAPLEASGTSGMKAALNGVPQLSTLDGWWAEGFNGKNGWAIPAAPPDADVDVWDMEHAFKLLEEQVVPTYYDRGSAVVSPAWASMMKHALAVAGERFSATRMLQEYVRQYYLPAANGDPPPDSPPGLL